MIKASKHKGSRSKSLTIHTSEEDLSTIFDVAVNTLRNRPEKRSRKESELLMEMLKRVKYTRDLYDKYGEFVLELILKNLRYMKGCNEDVLLEQGKKMEVLYIILNGKVEILGRNSSVSISETSNLMKGTAFGEIRKKETGQEILSARCKENCEFAVIQHGYLKEAIKQAKENNKIQFLLSLPCFMSCSRYHISVLLGLFVQKKYRRNDQIFNEGDINENIYIIKKGEVKVYKGAGGQTPSLNNLDELGSYSKIKKGANKGVELLILGRGQMFGDEDPELNPKKPFSVNCASAKVALYKISYTDFEKHFLRIAEVKKKFVRLCAEKSQWREKRLGIIQQVHNKIPNNNTKEPSSSSLSSVERRVKILPKSERKPHSTASTLLNLDENNPGEIRSLNYIPDKNSFFLTGVSGGDPSQGGHHQPSSYSQPQSKVISSLTTIDGQVKSRNDLDFGKDELQIQLEMARGPGSTKRGSILRNGLSIIHESSSSKQSISIMKRKSQLEKSIQSLAEKKKTIDYNTGSGAPEMQISRRASSRVSISGNFRDIIAKELYHKNLFEKVDHGEKENSISGGSFSCVHTPVKNRPLISNLFKSHRGDPKSISLAQENYTPGPDMSALLHQRSSRAQSNSLSNRNLHVDNGFKNQARRVVKSSEKRYRSPEQDLSEIYKIHKGFADMSYSSKKEIVADIREEHKRLKILLKKPEKIEKKRPKFMVESAKRPQRFDALNYYLPTNRVSARYPGENVSDLSGVNSSGVKRNDNKLVRRPRLGQESSVISNENREKSVDFECKSVRIPISVRAKSNLKNRSFF